jgi:1-deoxy-D-xylulose-5-phosphate synthase
LYASFLARAVGQIITDIALPGLGVTFLVDRHGLVGEDGATHQGTLAVGILQSVPGIKLVLPGDVGELLKAISLSEKTKEPLFIFYPKTQVGLKEAGARSGRLNPQRHEGEKMGWDELIVTTGWTKLKGRERAVEKGFSHLHLPIIKPFPEEVVEYMSGFEKLQVWEENGYWGGLGELIQAKLQGAKTEVRVLGVGDEFVHHASRREQLKTLGMDD